MSETQTDYLAEVKNIVLAGLKGCPAQVYFFGSRAGGRAGRASDIDVGVLGLEPLPAGMLAAIREELEESRIPYTVDLVDLSEVEPSFRDFVKTEGVLWNP